MTSDGRPVLRVVPYREKATVDEVFADVRGRLTFAGDPDASTVEEWPDV